MTPPNWLDSLRHLYAPDTEGLTRAVAARLFEANNRSKGAFYPGGFGFLDTARQTAWIGRAHRLLSIDRAAA